MRDVRCWVGFNRIYGVGPAKVRALIDHFGDLATAWCAELNDLREAGLDRRSIENLLNVRKTLDLDQEIERVQQTGARIVIWDDPDYPLLLKNLPDAPPVLYIKGELNAADREWTVAIVGTRRVTPYGRQITEELSSFLAANGLSAGIAYSRPLLLWSTSIRRIFPSNSCGFCARLPGSFPAPPSPVLMYKNPSGPNSTMPPL